MNGKGSIIIKAICSDFRTGAGGISEVSLLPSNGKWGWHGTEMRLRRLSSGTGKDPLQLLKSAGKEEAFRYLRLLGE